MKTVTWRSASLATKLVRTGTVLLLVALASIGLTLWVTWHLEGGAAAVNEAGRMRMQTWRLASAVQAEMPLPQRQVLVAEFDQSVELLRAGDATRPLFLPRDAEVKNQFARVQATWNSQRGYWLNPSLTGPVSAVTDADTFVRAIDELVLAIEQQLSRLTAILNLFQFVMMALALGGAVVMLYTGHLYVISPLAQLRDGLRQVESGDFATRISDDNRDEFGQVAAGFNRMAQHLQSLYDGLEASVEAKTRHIEAQRARLEALYEVSALLTKADSMTSMASGFVRKVRALVRADAAVVRWSDEAHQRYLLLASDCLPQDILEAERSLQTGSCACANATFGSGSRVIQIARAADQAQRICARAGFENLISVPIRLQQRLLGELDLFYRSPVTPGADELALLDALTSHLASGLEGLRAAALEREAAVAEERALLARELHDSIAQSLAFLKIQVQLLRNAQQRGNAGACDRIIDELDAGVRESISDVRELLVHFRTRTNRDDIVLALQETLQKFQHQSGLPTHLELHGEGLPLPPDVQIQVLHVIQEALSNVRKHAQADHVGIDVIKEPVWRFVVRDNGRGFDASQRLAESHVGMKIMRERAARIGAQVAVDSQPGVGTCVTLTLPAPTEPLGDALVRSQVGSASVAAPAPVELT